MANPKIIVVGGGLAGLSAVIKIAEMGGQADLFSIVPVKRSHSVCARWHQRRQELEGRRRFHVETL